MTQTDKLTNSTEFDRISLHYFGSLCESLGIREENIILPERTIRVSELREFLALRIGPWTRISELHIQCAVNKSVVQESHVISSGDEVAFFPPVTGG